MPFRALLLALATVPFLAPQAYAQSKAVASVRPVSAAEVEAVAFRRLQSELMVATLSCKDARMTAQYNDFVTRFRAELRENARVLKTFFHRLHGPAAQRRLDDFITGLANDASLASMGDAHFCAKALARFEAINYDEEDQTAGVGATGADLVSTR